MGRFSVAVVEDGCVCSCFLEEFVDGFGGGRVGCYSDGGVVEGGSFEVVLEVEGWGEFV